MVKVKPVNLVTQRWEQAIGQVPARYTAGVQAASDVIARSIAAEELWAEAMRKAIERQARAKGLQGLSDEDWRRAALQKGATRIGGGMRAALDEYREKIGKVLDVIAGISLPDKTTDPEQNVINRVVPIAKALREAKEQGRFA